MSVATGPACLEACPAVSSAGHDWTYVFDDPEDGGRIRRRLANHVWRVVIIDERRTKSCPTQAA
ncbi:hypothetical protein [Streptomyces sp. JNUCC 63]